MTSTNGFEQITDSKLQAVCGGGFGDWLGERWNDFQNVHKAYENAKIRTYNALAPKELTVGVGPFTGTWDLPREEVPFKDDPWSKVGTGKP